MVCFVNMLWHQGLNFTKAIETHCLPHGGFGLDALRVLWSTIRAFFTTSWPWCLVVTLPSGLEIECSQNTKFEAFITSKSRGYANASKSHLEMKCCFLSSTASYCYYLLKSFGSCCCFFLTLTQHHRHLVHHALSCRELNHVIDNLAALRELSQYTHWLLRGWVQRTFQGIIICTVGHQDLLAILRPTINLRVKCKALCAQSPAIDSTLRTSSVICQCHNLSNNALIAHKRWWCHFTNWPSRQILKIPEETLFVI